MQEKADIGLIGLAVMGENLALNIESRGYRVAVYNRTGSKTMEFVKGRGKGRRFIAATDLLQLVASLKQPRKIMMMVKAGAPVDQLIEQLLALMAPGDILIDGGNSHYTDTLRRLSAIEAKGLFYVGTGISGGEKGALLGPSLMPGGSAAAWPLIKDIFMAIAAKADGQAPCCEWMGSGGAGHFVKMVHNGIEYGDMQIIGEAYHLLRDLAGLKPYALHQVFNRWNKGDLSSYLIEITANIFSCMENDGQPVIDKILDCAGQKGTGRWAVISAVEESVPLTLISEALFARNISAALPQRLVNSHTLSGPFVHQFNASAEFVDDVERALLAAKIISYAQGFELLQSASTQYGWRLNLAAIALIWRQGCIIRSAFLDKIAAAYTEDPGLSTLIAAPFFREKLRLAQDSWRLVAGFAMQYGIPAPCLTSAIAYYDAIRCPRLPTNLLQAQRDYFGAHTFERVDRPRGEFFHYDWTLKD